MMRFTRAATLAALVWLKTSKQVDAAIDIPDFEDQEIFKGESFPTDFTWTPEGQMLVTKKEGILVIYDHLDDDNSFTNKVVALDLTSVICDNSHRGLGGVQVHPNFGDGDRWIYLFYTFKKNGNCDQDQLNGPVNRLSRFWLQGSNTIEKSSEVVLFDTPPLGFMFKNGGKIEFGKDGYLYVTVGDAGLKEVAQSKSNLLGSLIRIKDDGSIPDDNPFNGSNDVRCYKDGVPPQGSPDGARCQEIYSIGLRNPFRMAMDPNTSKTRCFINDVGASTWEEINEGCGDIKDVNYGYPRREGPCRHSRTLGCNDTEGYTNPIHFYMHVGSEGCGGAVTGGAFVPNDIGWPSEFNNGYLYADFAFGEMYLMKDDGKQENLSGSPPTSRMTISKFAEYESIISIRFGPYNGKNNGALYYASSETGGVMRRIAYVGDDNDNPNACSYEVLFYSGTVLWANGVMQNEKKTLYILQQDDGNLVLRTGTPDSPGELIWQSGISLPKNNGYYTKLQGDGHLMTRKWISDSQYETIWKTKVSGESQTYYFAAFVDRSCDGRGVSIVASATSKVLWTSYGAPSNPGACTPRPLLFAGDIVKRDQVVQQPGTNAFVLQESNGNLMVTKGSKDNPGGVVWRSGIDLAPADYYTKLQGDGNLITRPPSEIRGTVSYVWKSNVIGKSQDYFLGLNCDGVTVSVYEGTPNRPGSAFWTSPAQF